MKPLVPPSDSGHVATDWLSWSGDHPIGGTWSVNIVDLTHAPTVNSLCVNIVDPLVGECQFKINHFYYRQSFLPLLILPAYINKQLQ